MKKAALTMTVIFALASAVSCGNKTATIEPIEITAEEAHTVDDYKPIETEPVTVTTTEAVTEEATEFADAGEGTNFKSGTVNGKVYTSEYAGFKVTFPEDTALNDRAENEKELKKMWSTLDERSKQEQGMHITDLVANSTDTTYVFQYSNTKLMYPEKENVTVEEFMEDRIEFNETEDIKVSAPEKITISGMEYTKETIVLEQLSLELVYYARKIDDDFILVINSQGEAGFDHTILEKAIEAI